MSQVRLADLLWVSGGRACRAFGLARWGVTGSQRSAPSFTRSGAASASVLGTDGRMRYVSADRWRVTYRVEASDTVTGPYLRLEVPRTNAFSVALTSKTWTNSATWTSTTTGPDGVAASGKGVDHGSGGFKFTVSDVYTATDNEAQGFSIWHKPGDNDWCYIEFNRKDAGLVRVYFDTANGVVGTADSGVTGYIEPGPDGWWHCIAVLADVQSGGSSPQMAFGPAEADADNTMSAAGAPYGYFFGPSTEADTGSPSSTILVNSSRGAETFQDPFPWTPQQIAAMGGVTFYVDFIEKLVPSFVVEGAATAPRLIHVGSATGTAVPSLLLYRVTGGDLYGFGHANGVSTVASTADVNPTRGDRVQLAGQFNADGSVRIIARKNGGADVAGIASAALAPAAAWAGALIHLGGVGTTGRGIQDYRDAVVLRGSHSIDECESAMDLLAGANS